MLNEESVDAYLERTASSDPVPGGGSAAALGGAAAAALVEMVAGLTAGREKFAAVEEKMRIVAARAAELRVRLARNVEHDAASYRGVMAAFAMPRDTPEAREIRGEIVQEAFRQAAQVPLETARMAAEVLEMAATVVREGNPNAVTDGAVAAMMARTAVRASVCNVRINLGSIKDRELVNRLAAEARELEDSARERERAAMENVVLE